MELNIEKIIESRSLKVLFQPIVSFKSKKTIGYELLSRGINENGDIIGAEELFSNAKKQNMIFELDSVCRNIAIEKSKELMLDDKHLFLNYDVSDLNETEAGKQKLEESLGNLSAKLDFLGIKRSNVVIEIVESNVYEMDDLLFFTELCKIMGFLTALDDVGSGHSNLNRIPLIKPDIIKIDRFLISNIQNDYYKQEVFKSITNMAIKTGILVIAEGVETLEEALYSIELRTDMLQGYYIKKPSPKFCSVADSTIDKLHNIFKQHLYDKNIEERKRNKLYIEILKSLAGKLNKDNINLKVFDSKQEAYAKVENILLDEMKKHDFIECIYFMDKEGIQISKTLFKSERGVIHKSSLFSPAEIGEDHSLKQYFRKLHTNQTDIFISDNYISLATGNYCRTLSAYINENIILAIDIKEK